MVNPIETKEGGAPLIWGAFLGVALRRMSLLESMQGFFSVILRVLRCGRDDAVLLWLDNNNKLSSPAAEVHACTLYP